MNGMPPELGALSLVKGKTIGRCPYLIHCPSQSVHIFCLSFTANQMVRQALGINRALSLIVVPIQKPFPDGNYFYSILDGGFVIPCYYRAGGEGKFIHSAFQSPEFSFEGLFIRHLPACLDQLRLARNSVPRKEISFIPVFCSDIFHIIPPATQVHKYHCFQQLAVII